MLGFHHVYAQADYEGLRYDLFKQYEGEEKNPYLDSQDIPPSGLESI